MATLSEQRAPGPARPVARERMSFEDLLIAALLMVVWASNFVVAAIGLGRVPPFTLATLRFLFVAFPGILFVKPPKAAWTLMAAFGALFGVGQFGFLFLSIREGVSPALASLLIQTQVFFTAFLAALLFHERIRLHNVIAFMVAASGLVVIGLRGGRSAPAAGIVLSLIAALAWAMCNMVGRRVERREMVAFIIWSSLFAVAPLLAATIWFEGSQKLVATIVHPDVEMAAIIAWQALANTLWGYTVWNRLLGRYSAAQVAPLTLPVPVIAGLLSSLVLSEQISGWKIEACALVLVGLAVNVLGGRRRQPE